MIFKVIVSIIMIFVTIGCANLKNSSNQVATFNDYYYQKAFLVIDSMLQGKLPLDFKRAVFASENAYLNDSLNYDIYKNQIDGIVKKLKWYIKAKRIENYKTSGHYAVYSYLCEPTIINDSLTYKYDFNDFMGIENWTNTFVTKLMRTKKGNCHSLPFFFKILSEEMGVEAFIAEAPSHLYIKHIDEEGKWINIELTNGGGFSSDAWIISSMGISTESIKSGIYMSPLTLKESVALCLYDLAMGYKEKFGHNETVEMICDKVLEYYPTCIQAYCLKSDCLTKRRNDIVNSGNSYESTELLLSMKEKYIEISKKIKELGYTDMDPELYEKWSRSVEEEMKKNNQSTKINGESK